MTRLYINNVEEYEIKSSRYIKSSYYDYVDKIRVLLMQYIRRTYFRENEIPVIYLTNFDMAINSYFNEIRSLPYDEHHKKTYTATYQINGRKYQIKITDKLLNYI